MSGLNSTLLTQTEEVNSMTKLTATFLNLVLLTQIAPAVSAKPKGDWNAVKALAKNSIAVKTKNGNTDFGSVRSANDAGITVQIAGKEAFTDQEIVFRRDEIEKVWLEELRFGEKNTDYPMFGAGICAIAGALWRNALWKKKHKKQELVYSV
jgi:hypothetical protein